jgi:hypothetical protein
MITISAPATTATVAAIAVTRNTPTRRCRGGRRPRERARAVAGAAGAPAAGERLRCCDNAVLPSAKRRRAGHPERGPLRYKGSESHDGRLAGGVPDTQTQCADLSPGPSPHNVARTSASDQAFPPKKQARIRRLRAAQITVWQCVPLQLLSVIAPGCGRGRRSSPRVSASSLTHLCARWRCSARYGTGSAHGL